jgi:hypothetical protein
VDEVSGVQGQSYGRHDVALLGGSYKGNEVLVTHRWWWQPSLPAGRNCQKGAAPHVAGAALFEPLPAE